MSMRRVRALWGVLSADLSAGSGGWLVCGVVEIEPNPNGCWVFVDSGDQEVESVNSQGFQL